MPVTSKKRNLPQILKWAIIFGGSFGIILLLSGIIDHTIGYYDKSGVISGLNYCFRIVGLLICMVWYRNKVLHKNINFNQAFLFGFFTFFFAMFIVSTTFWIVFNYYPELLIQKLNFIKARLISHGFTEEQIEKNITSALWNKNPYYVTMSFLFWTMFVGPFVSLVAAILLMNTPARRRLKKRRRKKVIEKKEEPTISKILLGSQPEFDPDNADNKRNE